MRSWILSPLRGRVKNSRHDLVPVPPLESSVSRCRHLLYRSQGYEGSLWHKKRSGLICGRPERCGLVDTHPDSFATADVGQDANAPSHLVLRYVLSSIQLSADLGLWPMYRSGIILLSEVLASIEGQHMAPAAIREIENIWNQVRQHSHRRFALRSSHPGYFRSAMATTTKTPPEQL